MAKRIFSVFFAMLALTSCLGRLEAAPPSPTRSPALTVNETPALTPSQMAPEGASPPGPAVPGVPSLSQMPTSIPPTPGEPVPGAPIISTIGKTRLLQPVDPFYQEMLGFGYSLFQAGSIPAGDQGVYSAYVFTRFEVGKTVGSDTFVIAFFYWDGQTNRMLGTTSPPVYSDRTPVYPSYYRLANWDDPAASLMGLSRITIPDQDVYAVLHLVGSAADINDNNLPEFIFGTEYCPIACETTVQGYDFFEMSPDGFSRLGEDLSGRLELIPVSTSPVTLQVVDYLPFGRNSHILIPGFVEWDGNKFVDVTRQNEALMASRIEEHLKRIESQYGEPFGRDEVQADAYSLLLLYERLGLRQKALDVFLEVTELGHWAGENERVQCWLLLSRAKAQKEYAANLAFEPLVAISDFDMHANVPGLVDSFNTSGVDFSVCERWNR